MQRVECCLPGGGGGQRKVRKCWLKGTKFLCAEKVISGDLMYSNVTIANNTIL